MKLLRVNTLLRRLVTRSSVCMFHLGRCGSTVLASLLSEHRVLIRWSGEIFESMRQNPSRFSHLSSPFEAISERRNRFPPRPVYGLEIKFSRSRHLAPELLNTNLKSCINELRTLEFTKFIVLRRRNYLRQLLSSWIAWRSKIFHQPRNAPGHAPFKVTVNPARCNRGFWIKSLIEHLNDIDAEYQEIYNELAQDRILKLEYEDDILENPRIAYEKTCEFLDIRPHGFAPDLARTNPFRVADMIANFQEIEKCLSGTRFAWMLYD